MAVPAGKVAHVTGITFGPGALTGGFDDNGIITVDSPDNDNSKGNRISYCHFKDGPNMDSDLTVYNGYGVMDHCLLERSGGRYFFIFREKTYGGGSNDYGNGAWADYPWFGTDKFFFIENCTVNGPITIPSATASWAANG